MTDPFAPPPLRPSPLRDAAQATLSALRSTIVILAIPLLALVIRDHGWQWHEIRKVVLPNTPFAAIVFLGAWIWSFWNRRMAQRRNSSSFPSV